jgi:phosphopantetheinyl transferase
VTVLIIKTADLTAGQTETMNAALPAVRQECAARFALPSKRAESVAAAYLAYYAIVCGDTGQGVVYPAIRLLLEKAEPVAALAAKIGWPTGPHGKPFPEGVFINGKTLHVSISHSDGLVAAAVADSPVGIDIQSIPQMPPPRIHRIAARLHPLEQKRLEACARDKLAEEFCRLWACKESVLKLCGQGLSQPLSSFCVENDCTILDGKQVRLTIHALIVAYLATAEWV